MTRKIVVLGLLIMMFSLMFTGCSSQPAKDSGPADTGAAPDKTITLRIATYNPGEAAQSKVLVEFGEDIKRLTNGRVQYEFYPGSMLLAADKMYDGIIEGIADVGYSNLAYTFGRFPVTEVLDLPIGFPNGWVANHVAADFYNHFQPREFNDTHVLTLTTSSLNNIITINTPIRKPEDLKGLTLRGTGYIGQLVEAMGGVARALPMPEAYDYLSKNIIDGLLIPYETMQTYKYGEVVNNITEVWQTSSVYTFYITMNKNTWNSLPADVQEIITKYVEEEFIEKLAKMWNDIGIEGKRYAIKEGFEIYVVPENELPVWKEKAEKVINDYIDKMVAKGYSKNEITGWMDFIKERTEYWLNKQIELGIKSETGPPEVYKQY